MDRKHVIAYIELIFAVIVWGSSFVATKVALRDLAPVTIVWLRFAVGVIVLGITSYRRRQFYLPKKRELLSFAILGFLGITFHQWLQSNGLETAQASTTAWIVATTPIFIAILSWIFLHEKILALQVLGIFLATFGVLIIVSKGNILSIFQGNFGNRGDILIAISALNWAVFSILSKRSLQGNPATQMMFFVITIGWIFTTILFLTSHSIKDLMNLTSTSLLAVIFLGLFCSGWAYIAWYDGLKLIPATQVGAFLFIEPLVTVLLSWLILGEAFYFAVVIGGLLIIFGVWFVQRI
jgi:drug/metabolite transporter (DMT)-like permease